jgi:peptide/nickel transport system substrate-binding protein
MQKLPVVLRPLYVCLILALAFATQTFAQTPQQAWQTTLVFAVPDEPQTFDLHLNVSAITSQRFYPNIYESLLQFDTAGNFQPFLATSWNVSQDGLRYTFQLRRDVKFSDGTAFDAQAVKWNFDRLFALGRGPVGLYEPVREVAAQDTHTVVFMMKRPYAPFLSLMAGWQGALFMSPSSVQSNDRGGDRGSGWLHNHTVGTGPYMLESWAPDDQVVLIPNEHYRGRWRQNSIRRIVYRNIREPSTAMQLLLRGQVDVLEQLTQPDFIDTMRRVPTLEVHVVFSGVGSNTMQMFSNIKKPPFDNVMVRRAIAAAIDYDRIVATVFPKIGQPARGYFVEPARPWFDSSIRPKKRDLALAQRLMSESGVRLPSTPFPVELGWQAFYRAEREVAQIIKESLAPIGFDVQVVEQPLPVWRESVWRNTFQLTLNILGPRFPDPDSYMHFVFHSSNFRYQGFNPGYLNPQLDELIDRGRSTMNRTERAAIYRDVQKILDRDAVTFVLAHVQTVYAHRVGILNLQWNPSYGPYFAVFPIAKDPSTYPQR